MRAGWLWRWPMANRNRRAGDYFERRTRAALEEVGWVVIRSAGSLGAADLVALRAEKPTLMVSCKTRGALPEREAMILVATAVKAGALPILASRASPGWVALDLISPLGKRRLETLHMPTPRGTDAET